MLIRKLRLQRGWSQDQLAEMSGLSVRTIQRLERGASASVETLKSLAAVFECNFTDLQQEIDEMPTDTNYSLEEQEAIHYVRDIKAFYSHAISYALVIPFLFFYKFHHNRLYVGLVAGTGLGYRFTDARSGSFRDI